MIPKEMLEQNDKLNSIVKKYPMQIPVDVVTDFLKIDKQSFRAAAELGKIPFAFVNRPGIMGNRKVYIPTIAFYNWVTNGALFKDNLSTY